MENKQAVFTLPLSHKKCYTHVRYLKLLKAVVIYKHLFKLEKKKNSERCDKLQRIVEKCLYENKGTMTIQSGHDVTCVV
jgi:hypothetical protein